MHHDLRLLLLLLLLLLLHDGLGKRPLKKRDELLVDLRFGHLFLIEASSGEGDGVRWLFHHRVSHDVRNTMIFFGPHRDRLCRGPGLDDSKRR